MNHSEKRKIAKAAIKGNEYVPSPAKPQGRRAWRKFHATNIRKNGILNSANASRREIPNSIKVAAVIFGIVITWFYAEVLRGLLAGLSTHVISLPQRMGEEPAAAFATLVVGVAGYGFFELRRRHRITYAAIEFVVALLLTTEAFLRTSEPGSLAATALTSIYFVVRAFDNFEKGLEPYFNQVPAAVDASENSINYTKK
jgi:hypothetical protein